MVLSNRFIGCGDEISNCYGIDWRECVDRRQTDLNLQGLCVLFNKNRLNLYYFRHSNYIIKHAASMGSVAIVGRAKPICLTQQLSPNRSMSLSLGTLRISKCLAKFRLKYLKIIPNETIRSKPLQCKTVYLSY